MKKRIVLVIGYTCSGKTTYCSEYAAREGYHHLVVSDFVKKRLNCENRSELVRDTTKYLAKDIAIDLADYLEEHDKVIVDGIRQWTVVEFLCKKFRLHEIEIRWLEVPYLELKGRYERRNLEESAVSFEQAYQKDNDLGLAECKREINNLIQIIKNY